MNGFCASTAAADSVQVVTIAGELDVATAPKLQACLGGVDGEVHVDCADLTFLDCSGAHVFLETHERLSARGGRIVIHGLAPGCRRVFEALGVDSRLEITS